MSSRCEGCCGRVPGQWAAAREHRSHLECLPYREPHDNLLRRGRSVRRTRHVGLIQRGPGAVATDGLEGSLGVDIGTLGQEVVGHQPRRLIVRMTRAGTSVIGSTCIDILCTDKERRGELILAVDLEVVELERRYRPACRHD